MSLDRMQQDAQVRREYRLEQIRRGKARREQQNLLDPPIITDAIPDYDGLLPVDKLQADLRVGIPLWDWIEDGYSPGDADTITLFLKNPDGTTVYTGVQQYPLPLDEDAFPSVIAVPQDKIPAHGQYIVEYRLTLFTGTPTMSNTAPLIIDSQPPYFNPGQPATPAAIQVPVEVVTDQYLADNGNELVCTLPDYPDKARGDQVIVYFGLEIPEDIDAVAPVVGPIDVPVDLRIPIPGSAIQDRLDGHNYIFYWLRDKAGNFSDISEPASIDVQLGVMPDDLKPPQVPLAPISRLDALEPVMVEIPAFTGPDKVTVKALWGKTALAELKPGPAPQFPLKIQVPWSALEAEYDYTSTTDAQTVRVAYQVWRGPLAFPEAGPLHLDVEVDLSVVGPPDPDPDPVNPDLPRVHLTSSTGNTDKLTVADKGQPARASVLLHALPENEEVISLYWRDVVVDTFTVNGQSEGDQIDFNITWEQLLAGGNDPAFPMRYTIRGKDDVNFQQSEDTLVDVDIVTIDLLEPSFPTTDTATGWINCGSIDPVTGALPVFIPGNSTWLKDGDEITVVSQGFTLADIPVVGTEFSLVHTLQTGEAAGGATILIEPYEDKLLPIVLGKVLTRYSAVIDGQLIHSPVTTGRIALNDGTPDGTCPIGVPFTGSPQ